MEPQTRPPQSPDPLRAAEDLVLTGRAHIVLARIAGGLLLPFGIFVLAFLPSDRLLLGMKGSISEFGLGMIRARMRDARHGKALRGVSTRTASSTTDVRHDVLGVPCS
jgi:hypothetical protein